MIKQLANKARNIFIRLYCPHCYWHIESPLKFGSFSRGVIVCNNCGKKKLLEQLTDSEVLVELGRYSDYTIVRK